jgi:transcriptional regulator with XRE-family HTH domain
LLKGWWTMNPEPLAARMRQLRSDARVSQKQIAVALKISVPLVSSWEHGKALPGADRIDSLARFFAAARGLAGGHPRLPEDAELTENERRRLGELREELLALRPDIEPAGPRTRSPWEGLWHFEDQAPVTIVCARLPEGLRASADYSDPDSADYVELYSYSDLDALFELYGHVYAANPGVPVDRRLADGMGEEDVTNHLVLLGGVDWNPVTSRVMQELNLPVTQDRRGSDAAEDPDTGTFRVGEREFRPTLERGATPRLVEDVSHFCRGPNPYNRRRTVTICNGMFGRGTYAAVRTLTDPRFRDRNRAHIEQRYAPGVTYSILARANIVAGKVITPDWTQEGTVLHEWSSAA